METECLTSLVYNTSSGRLRLRSEETMKAILGRKWYQTYEKYK